MPEYVRNHDESRLPPRDENDRVPHDQCTTVKVKLMLPPDHGREEVRALMDRLYEREPSVLHWHTYFIEPRA